MGINVLVVDNNSVLLKAVSTILTQEGCSVMTAGTGLEAMEILDRFEPEIVFTDLIMPLVSGEQLCRILRGSKKFKDVFIVLLSGIILEEQEKILDEIDCDLCIAKGNLNDIRTHIREALAAYSEKKTMRGKRASFVPHIPAGLKPSVVTTELLAEKQHHANVLANLDDGILELSGKGKIVAVNRSAMKLLQVSEAQLLGVFLPECIDWGPFGEKVTCWIAEQYVPGRMESYRINEENPFFFNSKVFTVSFLPVKEDNSFFGLCVFRDITRQYQAEQYSKELDNAIKLAKKMDAMSCMAGGVAHDFNNLLTVVCGNLDILALFGGQQEDGDRADLLDQARRAAFAAVDLTRQISTFSNLGIISRKVVPFAELATDAAEKFFQLHDYPHLIEFESGTGSVFADSEQIKKVIENVLRNAVEASCGQPIRIRIAKEKFSRSQLVAGQYIPSGSYARLDIADSGRGIDTDSLVKIFDPYYSTKERGAVKGMGLGLAIVYSTMRNHGGYVIVESATGQGTVVSLFLPFARDVVQPLDVKKRDPLQPCHVIMLESDPQMHELAGLMLRYLGYSTTITGSRTECLKAVGDCKNDTGTARELLIILDLTDTAGESALETCKILRATDARLKIIAMSGDFLDPVMEQYAEYGFAAALPKPYSMDSLNHILTNTLAASPGQ